MSKYPYCIEVVLTQRTYYLHAPTLGDMEDWMRVLDNSCVRLQQDNDFIRQAEELIVSRSNVFYASLKDESSRQNSRRKRSASAFPLHRSRTVSSLDSALLSPRSSRRHQFPSTVSVSSSSADPDTDGNHGAMSSSYAPDKQLVHTGSMINLSEADNDPESVMFLPQRSTSVNDIKSTMNLGSIQDPPGPSLKSSSSSSSQGGPIPWKPIEPQTAKSRFSQFFTGGN